MKEKLLFKNVLYLNYTIRQNIWMELLEGWLQVNVLQKVTNEKRLGSTNEPLS